MNDVRSAQGGDRAALARVYEAYRPMALAVALGWLKSEAASQDAVQEAFFDATHRLHQLKEPAAFGGWLLRIVRKHCDRQTRRKEFQLGRDAPADDETEKPRRIDPGFEKETPLQEPTKRLEKAEEQLVLLRAIAELPEHERIVVALHYFGECPVRITAQLLEVSPDAVKQRLRRARERLAKGIHTVLSKRELTEGFSENMELFMALRCGDLAKVEVMLNQSPELIEATENYDTDAALSAGMTLAHQLTPLLLASELGDLSMVRFLLSRGAPVDGRCGCDTAETPLFAAAVRGHDQVVHSLLQAGAQAEPPGLPSPLAIARRRQHTKVVEALAGRLERTTDLGLAARIESGRIHTGIAALDLLAPLQVGQKVSMYGAAETGLYVLIAEISYRMAHLGWPVTWTSFPKHAWQVGRQGEVVRRYGLEDRVRCFENEVVQRSGLHVLFPAEGREAQAEAHLSESLGDDSLLIVVYPWETATRTTLSNGLRPPFDASLVTSSELAQKNIFPALDPSLTESTTEVGSTHEQLRKDVRAGWREPRVQKAFFQWFEVCYPETQEEGAFLDNEETLNRFREALRKAP